MRLPLRKLRSREAHLAILLRNLSTTLHPRCEVGRERRRHTRIEIMRRTPVLHALTAAVASLAVSSATAAAQPNPAPVETHEVPIDQQVEFAQSMADHENVAQRFEAEAAADMRPERPASDIHKRTEPRPDRRRGRPSSYRTQPRSKRRHARPRTWRRTRSAAWSWTRPSSPSVPVVSITSALLKAKKLAAI